MAGNTKFMGFGIKGMVTLARWGGEAHVELSQESVEALRQACHDGLPMKPPVQLSTAGTKVDYDEETGVVVVRLDPEKALELGNLLEESIKDVALAIDLKNAHKEHVAFNDVSKEPGIDERTH